MIPRSGPYRPEKFGLDPAVCWGVHLGGCVEMGSDEVHRQVELRGHAHTSSQSYWHGWICIINPNDAFTRRGGPTNLVLHEYAHLLCGERVGHGAKWKTTVTALGAGAEAKKYERVKKEMPQDSA